MYCARLASVRAGIQHAEHSLKQTKVGHDGMHLDPSIEEAETGRALGFTSLPRLAYLVSSKPGRDPILKTQWWDLER